MGKSPASLSDQTEVVGARRQLSIVFVDLVESTRLSALLDPEDLAALILAYQAAGQRIFTAYGGYVAQFLGDGLLVYFGYPRASENDPERAVRAAMQLLGELDAIKAAHGGLAGARFEARVGIHTGMAVVGASVHAGRSVIFGEAINVASRIQAAATPGTVFVSATTLPLLKRRFVTRAVGLSALKGVAAPMALHRVVRLATASGPAAGQRSEPSLVGRAAQLGRITARWHLAGSGKPSGVAIVGDPGMGKSCLLHAFRATLDPASVTWLEAQCDPFSSGTSLHPFIALIRNSLGIPEGIAEAEGLRRLRRSLAALPRPMQDAVPVIGRLLGFTGESVASLASESPERLRQMTLDTLIDWIACIAIQRPVMLVCEDLHWSDASTLEFLERLLTRAVHDPVFCAVTYRPGFSRPSLAKRVEKLDLGLLDPGDAEQLAREAAAPHELDAEVIANVLRRAGGNPLFIQELAKFAGEFGADDPRGMQVPPTLDSLVLERLDRLDPAAKHVAQNASALGKEFDASFLAAVSGLDPASLDGIVDSLLGADILRGVSTSDRLYVFRHALTQDAAYGTLLRAERENIHRRAADCLRTDFASRAAAQPEIVAHHLLGARQHVEAAQWFMRAGLRAAKRAAVEDAATLYRRGLKALEGAGAGDANEATELSLQILLGNALIGVRGFGSAEIIPVWERALVLAEKLDNVDETSSALNGLAAYYIGTGDCHRAMGFANRILARSGPGEDRIGRLRAHTSLASCLYQIGEGAEALSHAELAISLYRPTDFATVTYGVGTDQGVIAYGAAAFASWGLGRSDAALAHALRGVALAESLESALSLAAARSFLVLTYHCRRDYAQAHRAADENVVFCAHLGIPFWLGFSRLLRGGQPVDPPPKRLEDVNEGLALLAKTGSRSGIGLGFAILAEVQQANGAAEAGLKMLDMGLQMSAALRQHVWDAELMRVRGAILSSAGRADEAEVSLRAALDEAQARGCLALRLRAALSLAEHLEMHGRRAEGRAMVAECIAGHSEGGDTTDARTAAFVLDRDMAH